MHDDDDEALRYRLADEAGDGSGWCRGRGSSDGTGFGSVSAGDHSDGSGTGAGFGLGALRSFGLGVPGYDDGEEVLPGFFVFA